MDDIPWPLVVMVFIGFIGWVRNRIREAAEARREKAAIRRGEIPHSTYEEEDEPWLVHEEETRVDRERTRQEKDPQVPSTLRDLMTQMQAHDKEQEQQRQVEDEEEPFEPYSPHVPARATPPPLPDKSMTIELADVEVSSKAGTMADVGGLGKIAKIAGVAEPPSNAAASAYQSQRKQSNPTVKRVVRSFRDRQSIQSAFILKEILDTPKGLE